MRHFLLLLLLLPACGKRAAEKDQAPVPAADPAVAPISLAESERRVVEIEKILQQVAADSLTALQWAPTHPPEAHVYEIFHFPGGCATTAHLQATGTDGEGIWTKASTIKSQWRFHADGRIEPLQHHPAQADLVTHSERPWFTDRTEFAAGKLPAFRQHLSKGLDHWLPRIEAAHGIDAFIRNGMALGDADGDGRDDLYICQPGGLPNRLLLHRPDGTLAEALAWNADYLDHTSAALFIDLDNDGDQDLALATPVGIVLLENAANKNYTDRGALRTDSSDSHALSAADYDLDGDLDLYITFAIGDTVAGAQAGEFEFHDARDGGRNQLFRNDGQWSFSEVTGRSGLSEANDRHSLAASWNDFDLDGDTDLYVANDYGPNQLYRNAGGKFTEVAAELQVLDRGAGMSVSWGDYDRDGRPDLYVGNMFSNAGRRITAMPAFLGEAKQELRAVYRRFAKGNSLFRQTEAGPFTEYGSGVEMGRWAWSSVFADLDNDGWQDLFVANGYISGPKEQDL